MRTILLIAASLAVGLFAQPVCAQTKGKGPIKINAEDLAKECAADKDKATAKYAGKPMQVSGVVGDVYDDILYLPAKVKGEEVLIGIRYGKGKKPTVKKGDEATFEGKFDRIAVLGPALTECKLIPKEDKKK